MNFGVIGFGYWGPNVVRNLASLEGSQVVAIGEVSASARKRAQKAYPGVRVTGDVSEVMASPEIDAIAVITPVWTHYELAKSALENGKHVFVEKPFTSNVEQGEELMPDEPPGVVLESLEGSLGLTRLLEQCGEDGEIE